MDPGVSSESANGIDGLLTRLGYLAVGFHIVQIGDSPIARAFLQEIEGDAEVSPHVYISAENIGDGRIGGVKQSRAGQNELWVSYMVP